MKFPKGLGIGIVAFAAGALVVNQFKHKITVGNLVGLRVTQMALVDTTAQKAFDENGKAISMDDPYVSDFKDARRKDRISQRMFVFTVPNAQSIRVKFNGIQSVGMGSYRDKYQTAFPVQDNSSSIPYSVEGTADNWSAVATWHEQTLSNQFAIKQGEESVNVSIKNLPKHDPDNLGEEFKVEFYPPGSKVSESWSTLGANDNLIWATYPGKLKDLRKITVYQRTFHTISSGFLAFGARGEKSHAIQDDHQIFLSSVCQPNMNNSEFGDQWEISGKRMPYSRYWGSSIQSKPANPHESLIAFRLLAGDSRPDVSIGFASTKSIWNFMTSRTGRILKDKIEYECAVRAIDVPDKSDVTFLVSSGPFKEIARSTVRSNAKLGSEEKGSYVRDIHLHLKAKGYSFIDYLLKIPAGFEDSEFKVSYIDQEGVEHDTGGNLRSRGYVGFQRQGQVPLSEDIKGIIVYSREYMRYPFKDIHLKPHQGDTSGAKQI